MSKRHSPSASIRLLYALGLVAWLLWMIRRPRRVVIRAGCDGSFPRLAFSLLRFLQLSSASIAMPAAARACRLNPIIGNLSPLSPGHAAILPSTGHPFSYATARIDHSMWLRSEISPSRSITIDIIAGVLTGMTVVALFVTSPLLPRGICGTGGNDPITYGVCLIPFGLRCWIVREFGRPRENEPGPRGFSVVDDVKRM
jgi:hypothetical protein